MKSPSSRESFKLSSLLALAGQPFSLVGQMRETFKRVSGGASRALRGRESVALEAMEPRTLLAANITYAYSVADAPHFNDGDLLNNHYSIAIADVGGSDHLQVRAEDGTVLADGALSTGLNKLMLTGADPVLMGDQYNIDFTNFTGHAGGFQIQIITDGKGVIPLIGQDDKVTIIGDSVMTNEPVGGSRIVVRIDERVQQAAVAPTAGLASGERCAPAQDRSRKIAGLVRTHDGIHELRLAGLQRDADLRRRPHLARGGGRVGPDHQGCGAGGRRPPAVLPGGRRLGHRDERP